MKRKITLWPELLKKINKTHLLIGALTGILLLVIALPVEDAEKTARESRETSEVEEGLADSHRERNTYQEKLEQQLEQTLSAMEGVGKVKVMITLKDEGEAVVEKDLTRTEEASLEEEPQGTRRENSAINSQEETIYIQGDSVGSTPFVTREVKPQVEGVLVVAQGGKNAVVAKNISDAVLALFPVEAHKIKVVKMNE